MFHDLICTGLFTHLLGSESLVHVGVLQEPGHREKVGSCVHHDEEERPRQVEAGNVGVILHNKEQKPGDLLHQGRVKGQQQLELQSHITLRVLLWSVCMTDKSFTVKLFILIKMENEHEVLQIFISILIYSIVYLHKMGETHWIRQNPLHFWQRSNYCTIRVPTQTTSQTFIKSAKPCITITNYLGFVL